MLFEGRGPDIFSSLLLKISKDTFTRSSWMYSSQNQFIGFYEDFAQHLTNIEKYF